MYTQVVLRFIEDPEKEVNILVLEIRKIFPHLTVYKIFQTRFIVQYMPVQFYIYIFLFKLVLSYYHSQKVCLFTLFMLLL